MPDPNAADSQDTGFGCVVALLVLNLLFMGLLASTFAAGPYSSREQEIWYRYGSLGFLLFGAILPGAALIFGGRRSRARWVALGLWMFFALFACFFYAVPSSGGV